MPCRRSCGNSWSYSWSTQQPVVQYYYPAQAEAPQVQQASSAGQKTERSSKSSGKSLPIAPADFEGDYHEYGMYLHNWYRRRHGSPPVTMLDRLNKAGDAYCAKRAAMRTLMHSSGLDYNENLFMSFDTSISKKEAVRQACKCWYDEIKLYSFSSPGFSMSTGHFKAMVWKGVTKFGVGCWEGNGCIVVAGCYKPHANMQGQFSSNVLPYREVDDTDEEEEDEESDKEKSKQLENVASPNSIKSKESSSETSKGDIPPAAKEDFAKLADSDGTIGWEKLNN
ncbi:protein PRY1-like [Folsomia candida]|uniref:protein PRY1-like n=1 Tax=Folsomia candida TaxID=158441 RepID=UPI001604FDE3|nr:protein PRY1-like [Folsomia candida]